MIYIYDSIITPGKEGTFERYGANYKLEKRHKMGNQVYYSYVYPGMEKILVIPGFVSQYREIEAKVMPRCKKKSFEDCKKIIRRLVDVEDEDQYPTDGGMMDVLICQYKDIGITFTYEKGVLSFEKEFEIRQNNIFGNGLVISMITDQDEDED